MLNTFVCKDPAISARHWTPALLCLLLSAAETRLQAQAPALPPVTVGAGVQTSFVYSKPEGTDATDSFLINSLRLYVNGPVTNKINFTVNTEYDGPGNHVIVMDAIARFELSDKFNIWAGRMLPPSDRSNLYGNYYAHHWSVFSDGIQDGYPFVAVGRDNGAAYWGQFGPVKVSAGGYDGASATGDSTLIGAGRVMVDFWDPEPGYYLNSTYYGTKNILAVGIAGQTQGSDKKAYSVDFLLDKKLGGGSGFTIESEYAKYDRLGGYNPKYRTDDGGYVLGSYLFPGTMGAGRVEILGKFTKARFRQGLTAIDRDYDQNTNEINLNYIIKEFNARVMVFYKDTRFNAVQSDSKQIGVGVQLQM